MTATWEIREGEVLDRLREIPDGSVQCCVTSPPYWGLRDYGTGTWAGGDAGCNHRSSNTVGNSSTLRDGRLYPGEKKIEGSVTPFREQCPRCGALRIDRQIGLEATPEEWVDRLVEVFREVRRVLCADGTLWLNLGDSYSQAGGKRPDGQKGPGLGGTSQTLRGAPRGSRTAPRGMKPKDLVGQPWMVAFALRADGWWLRSDIIWAKPSPMPESVTDRPTRAHEYLFLLSKSARYFYDADAIRDPHSETSVSRVGAEGVRPDAERKLGVSTPDGKQRWNSKEIRLDERGANKRSVWTVASQPFPEAHFATYPPKLIEPCILAGSRPGDLVLDPFSGSGTTGVVALRHDRDYIGIELNPEYVELSRRRICDDAPLLNTVAERAA